MRPAAGKCQDIKSTVIQMQAGGKRGSQRNSIIPGVFDAHAPANRIAVRKNRVGKRHIDSEHQIPAMDFQRTAFLGIPVCCGQPIKRLFTLCNTVVLINKLTVLTALCRFQSETRLPKIAAAPRGIFPGERVEKGRAILSINGRYIRRFLQPQKILHIIVRNARSVIDMPQKTLLIGHAYQISGVRRVEPEYPLLFAPANTHHRVSSLASSFKGCPVTDLRRSFE